MLKLNQVVLPAFFLALTSTHLALSQDNGTYPGIQTEAISQQQIDNVVYLAGSAKSSPNAKGVLTLTSDDLRFTSGDTSMKIPARSLSSVSVGDERVERGGTVGRIARATIPYGGGQALGAASQHSVDLLTVEYSNTSSGYHGAVFVLPTKQAEALRAKLATQISSTSAISPASCSTGTKANSILLAPITANGVEVPAEYKVLMYENLLASLQQSFPNKTVVRAGSLSAGQGCTATTVHLSIGAFAKGNQAVRASTGPIGFFVATTSVSFHMTLENADGKTIADRTSTGKMRWDSDSLNVTRNIAKDVTKTVKKTQAAEPPATIAKL